MGADQLSGLSFGGLALEKVGYVVATDKGVVIIGVCSSRGGEKMKQTAEQHGIEYPVALDADGKVVGAYAVNSYPDYYIIGSDGKLRWGDIANADVEKAIEHLLAEK